MLTALGFTAPLALLGLLALPVIRWLHRGGRHRRAVAVAYLGLWQAAAAGRPQPGEKQPPDPAWRRRALLAALLCVALAGPRLETPPERITLWVDDAPSLLVREGGGTRLALGLDAARAQLAAVGVQDVEVRALGDPWHALDLGADELAARLAAGAGGKPPSPPPAALLRSDRRHWLLTDGVHAEASRWPDGLAPERVIHAGAAAAATTARNVGIERAAARRHVDDAGRVDLLVKLANGGAGRETRTLVVSAGGRELARATRELTAGDAAFVSFTLPAATQLQLRLEPGDALALDDTLVLDLAPLAPRPVAVDASCPPALRAALLAHPALRAVAPDAVTTAGTTTADAAAATANATPAAATLDCGGIEAAGGDGRTAAAPSARARPTLRVRAERRGALPRAAALWSARVAASERPLPDAARLPLAARLPPQPGDELLLAFGDEPAIVRRAGSPVLLETAIDFASPAAETESTTPLVVNWLFERLLGTRLLDATMLVDRGAGASRVVAAAIAPQAAASSAASAPATTSDAATAMQRDATRLPALAAGLVLLWELAALVLQWRRLRGSDEASA